MGKGDFVRRALGALDQAIADAARAEYARLSDGLEPEECAQEVEAAFQSLDRLRPQSQPDHPDQPDYLAWDSLFYLTWYQPRQVHLVYAALEQCFPNGLREPLRVIDLGCGAGAVQFALAIFAAESRRDEAEHRIAVHGIDPSRAMLRLGRKLWTEWRNRAEEHPGLQALVDTMEAMSDSSGLYESDEAWASSASARDMKRSRVPCWLSAIHAVYRESYEEIEDRYDRICDSLATAPHELVASDGSKRDLVSGLTGDDATRLRLTRAWSGVAGHTTEWRRTLCSELESVPRFRRRSYLQREVRWDPRNKIERDAVRVRFQ